MIPDTQHYVDSADRTGTFNQQTQWIVDNADDLNIVFVSQLGDITENFDTAKIEWQRADSRDGHPRQRRHPEQPRARATTT